jgi:predicted amino acid dehydrogenase
MDAVFITNMRDEVDRLRFRGRSQPIDGHFPGPRYWFNGITGRTRAIDSTARDLLSLKGRKKAKQQFLSAVTWAAGKGAKVILLAASTKRLFGDDGKELKAIFPNIVFTIGDNGTSVFLLSDVTQAFAKCGISPRHSRIAILGPYGLLGEVVTRFLTKERYTLVGAGSSFSRLKQIQDQYGISICRTLKEIGKVDAVVACTHSPEMRLSAESINGLRMAGKRLLVLDVAEPANMEASEYSKCDRWVIRLDAGNAFSNNLKYVLGSISYKMFRLSEGITFGCFAETLSLACALRNGTDIRGNWFEITQENMDRIRTYFELFGFAPSHPRCFGKLVNNIQLDLEPSYKGIEALKTLAVHPN